MFKRIQILKNKGYTPSTILDIGAYKGYWTELMKNIYNDCNYYLFEAIDYSDLDKFKDVPNVTVFKNVVLNDKIDTVDWYEMQNTGDSFFKEKTSFFKDCVPTKRQTIDLDTLLNNNNILKDDKNILIKIDCQGAEIPILKGAKSILDRTDFIILEVPLFGQYNEGVPNFHEHIKFMDTIGFIPYDIVDLHYANDFNIQVDVMFINKNHQFNKDVSDSLLHPVQ